MYGAQWSSLEFCGCLIIQPNDEGKSLVLKKVQDIIEGIRNDGKIDDKKGRFVLIFLVWNPPWLKTRP